MKRIVLFVMTTLTILVLIFGYHTSTSSRAAGGGTAFVSTAPTTTAETSLAPKTTLAEPSAAPTSAATTSAATTSAATTRTSSSSASTTTPATASSKTSAAAATTGSTAAKATTSTGSVADTRWGPVQVQVTVVSGKITSVAVLQYPNGNGRDQEINATALPILVQETLTAQGANIDMVSGATVTSGGYLTSLQSALDQM